MAESVMSGTGRAARVTTARIVAQSVAMLGRSLWRTPFVWIAFLLVAGGSDLVLMVYGVRPGHGMSAAQIGALVARAVLSAWIVVAALRRFVKSPAYAWLPDWGVLFYIFWSLFVGLLAQVVDGGLEAVTPLLLGTVIPISARDWVLVRQLITTPLAEILLFMILPWPIAIATRVPGITLRSAIRRMRGLFWPLLQAFLILVVPLFFVHVGLTRWLQHSTLSQPMLNRWVAASGAESVVLALMTAALYATIFRRAVPEEVVEPARVEPAPEPEQSAPDASNEDAAESKPE